MNKKSRFRSVMTDEQIESLARGVDAAFRRVLVKAGVIEERGSPEPVEERVWEDANVYWDGRERCVRVSVNGYDVDPRRWPQSIWDKASVVRERAEKRERRVKELHTAYAITREDAEWLVDNEASHPATAEAVVKFACASWLSVQRAAAFYEMVVNDWRTR